MMQEKLLPQNIDAEGGVLGSILIDPEAIVRVTDFLLPEDFYRDAHKTIYEAALRLYEQREPPDLVTICDVLAQDNHLEEVGGIGYITSLVNQVPTASNAEFYGRIVERTSILRRIIYAAGNIAATAYEEGSADIALDKAEQMLYSIRKRRSVPAESPLSTILAACLDDIEQLHERRQALIGIPTGFVDLDRLTGGLQRTDLIVLAARPGMGKTSWALNVARYLAKHGYRAAFYSLEMSRKQLGLRLLSQESGIDSQDLRRGPVADSTWESIVTAHGDLSSLPLWIDDTPALSTMALRSRARRLQAEQGIDLIIVDYLQLMRAYDDRGKRYENTVQEVTEISQALKALAKELNVPVLALSQLSRAVESRQDKHPQLSDLRSSGSIEQDADIVLFLYRDEMYHPDTEENRGKAEIDVAKDRNGPTGSIDLRFDAVRTKFRDA